MSARTHHFGLLLAAGMLGVAARPVVAQETSTGVALTSSTIDNNRMRLLLLGRKITLHLDHVTLDQALSQVAAEAHVQLTYSRYLLPLDRMVSLTVDTITVGDALHLLLRDTDASVDVLTGGRIILERAVVTPAVLPSKRDLQQGTAVISGYVRDSATGAAIPQVLIRVDGTSLETKSDGEGSYKITGVVAGEYRVTARRVGYVAKTRSITVNDAQSATLDFQLNPPATKLDEVVTTAVGEQRRYQVGNVISSINVDSIAPTAPVTSVMDLISGRAPGVEVISQSGMAGAGSSIRIWGQGSLLLQSDPIIIVDGMRVDNAEGATGNASLPSGISTTNPTASRINDLDFSQIATIDILKGPSATTEYGSDAANGVIVITTKRGSSGAPQWHASAEQSASVVPKDFTDYYYSWAHTTDGNNTLLDCNLVSTYAQYGGQASTAGNCLVDSITAFDPLNHSATTDIGTGPSAKYNIDVGGGSDALRYYLSAGLTNDIGGTKLPDVFRGEAAALGFPESALNPNSETQRSVRANTTFGIGRATWAQAVPRSIP